MKSVILIDCNNFFVSCERVFNPSLDGKPVVVLSSNDGCVVSRSQEAKQLGIPMGAPAFQWEHVFRKENVHVFSSHFSLYADMSRRVMETVRSSCQEFDQYSVDEFFVYCNDDTDYREWCRDLRRRIAQWTGIPTSIGIAPTKTLAKIANKIAKKNIAFNGIVDWQRDIHDHERILESVDCSEVWGIGRRYTRYLSSRGIHNARQLRDADDVIIKKNLSILGVRICYELRGISCIELTSLQAQRKTLTYSRSFGTMLTKYDDLSQAITLYSSYAAYKLRRHRLVASAITVYIRTNRFRDDLPQYSQEITVRIVPPSHNTVQIIECAQGALRSIFKQGYHYAKAGVVFTGLCPEEAAQHSLFPSIYTAPRYKNAMKAMDTIIARYGKKALYPASCGVQRQWLAKSAQCSPSYISSFKDIPICYAR